MKKIKLLLLACLVASALGMAQAPVQVRAAATITVANVADDTANGNGCSLREAITNANNDASTFPDCAAGSGADTIIFTSGLNGTIALASPLPVLNDTDGLTISGGTNKIKINGGGSFRVFEIGSGVPVTIQNLTLEYGAGNGGNIYNAGTLSLVSSTLTNGVGTFGGAIYNFNGIVSVTNSTFTANSADFGGALYNDTGTTSITNATIHDNSITGGGTGILYNNGSMTIKNTILADGNGDSLCAGIPLNAASTNNLADDLTCGPSFGSVTIGQLALGALADNGGSTWTFKLLPASVAIDAASNVFCPATDQRGTGRPQGTVCDIGSFELKISLTVSPASLAFGNGVIPIPSTPKIVTITNTGESNLVVGAITITTLIVGEFTVVNDLCSGQVIPPMAGALSTCTFGVTFTPTTPIAKTGTVFIPTNILTSPTTIPLSGAGIVGTNLLGIPTFDVITIPIPWRNPSPPYTLNAVRDCTVAFSLPCSVRFQGTPANRLNQIYQGVTRRGLAGARFLIRLSSKANAIPPLGVYRGTVEFYNQVNQLIATFPLNFSVGTHDWEHLEMTVTVPVNYSRMVFRIALKETSGTAWFDNAAIISIP